MDRREFRVLLAIALAGEGDRPLGDRNGLGVLALPVQPTDLGQQPGEVIGPCAWAALASTIPHTNPATTIAARRRAISRPP